MNLFARHRFWVLALLLTLAASACGSVAEDDRAAESVAGGDDVAIAEPSPETTAPVATTTVVDEVVQAEELIVESSGASDGDLALLSAVEIQTLLIGNTIIGNWVGEDYRQFFDEDGTTTYRPTLSGRDSVGEWRVNADSGLYESLWPGVPTWDDYEVHRDGDTYFWTGQGVQLSPFIVVEGDQLAPS